MKRMSILAIASLLLFTSIVPAFAAGDDKAVAIIGDTVLVRPLGIAATAIGAAFFIVSLPFAVISGSVDGAAQDLVVKPAKFTFTRPLGEFPREITYRKMPSDH